VYLIFIIWSPVFTSLSCLYCQICQKQILCNSSLQRRAEVPRLSLPTWYPRHIPTS